MDVRLFVKAIIRFLLGLVLVAALLFVPAGTTGYWQARLLIGILFIPMFIAGLVIMVKSPKRLFAAAGLSFRYGWFMLPAWVSYAAAVVFLASYVLYAEVIRENEWLSRTIEVQEGQKVVDTGLYGIVRHPMYMCTILLFLSMPLVLGSLISFLIMLLYIPIIAKRIRNEEKVLEEGLDGYIEYEKKVRYRMIPFVW